MERLRGNAQDTSSPVKAAAAAADRGAPQTHVGPETGVAPPQEPSFDPQAAPSEKEAVASAQPPDFIRQVELVDMVRAYDPAVDEDLLNRAYVFSMKAHGGQTRKSGDPYFTHPLAVAKILTELKADPSTVATALLHDVVEDTEVSVSDIEARFGGEIARLVDGVTKLSKIELRSDASKQAENFRKLVMAMAEDVRVLLVKLADRLHNMRTLHFFDNVDKRRRIALETMEIYAPLAGRIGVQRIREELEEISFRELNPDAFLLIKERLDRLQDSVVGTVVDLAQRLRANLDGAGIAAEVHSREKRPFSIWRKMSAKNVSFDEIADIYAFRIIVDSVEDCYKALGVIHTAWRMIPAEFDDYISASKPNNYQSIHTAVIGPPTEDGARQRVEIQIRTRAMHETAERGVAAHWRYKDRVAGDASSVEIAGAGPHDPYETPRRLVEMFQQGEDPDEALRYVKMELFQDQVFCFSPKGRVIALPKGSTGLDFAYAVHTDVGDTCVGVKINGADRPLRTPLKNGDVVLVLRSDTAPPPAGWEAMAVTGRARTGIRRRIKKMKRAEHVALGRTMAENLFQGVQLDLTPKAVQAALDRLKESHVDDVFAKVGRGDLAAEELIEAVYPGASLEVEGDLLAAAQQGPVSPRRAIEGLPAGARARMGRCCAPVPGERIVGIRGDDPADIIVHTIYCDRLDADDPEQSRWIDLKWRDGEDLSAETKILVTVRNEVGVLSDVAGVIARYNVSIASISLSERARDFVELEVDVVVKDARQLSQMLAGVRALSNVVEARRAESDRIEEIAR